MAEIRLQDYEALAGRDAVAHIRQLAKGLKGKKVVHVNSTRYGGGVAEILDRLVPIMNDIGIDTHWEVIEGDAAFYRCTKGFHNALQGKPEAISRELYENYERVNKHNAERLQDILRSADFVFIHDPQPAALIRHLPDRKGKWIWRCHIDVSRPYRPVWKYLQNITDGYNASIWSLADFVQPLNHPQYLIPPSIDPLTDKNVDLPEEEINAVREQYGIRAEDPITTQVSRFDHFKDPVGVIRGFELAKEFVPHLQLILAGGTAADDPEGEAVLADVQTAAKNNPDIHICLLPPDAHRTINAFQRMSDIVVQKSVKEGFGLTVTEAMWKGKPVIGGNAGGIRLQVIDYHTGFLVNSPEGMALRLRFLLDKRDKIKSMGDRAKQFAREHFLITRHVREYLTVMVSLSKGAKRIEARRVSHVTTKRIVVNGVADMWDRVANAERRVLALDYDGTLAPFRVERLEALPMPGILKTIESILHHGNTRVLIVSGRPLLELTTLTEGLRIERIASHGYEWQQTDGEVRIFPITPIQSFGLDEAVRTAMQLGYETLLERKVASIALHTRGKQNEKNIIETVSDEWKPISDSTKLQLIVFNGGIEIRATGRNKGSALLEALADEKDSFIAYLGDDETDEDVFRLLYQYNGIGIRVGNAKETVAHGRLADWNQVPDFLRVWYETVQH